MAGPTFQGASPDLLIEDDVNAKTCFKDYKVLVVVGDHCLTRLVPAVEAWVKGGGVLFRRRRPGCVIPIASRCEPGDKLAGLKGRKTDRGATFLRPRQELPFLEPLGTIKGKGWKMPALGTHERGEAAEGTVVLAHFDDKSPAVFERKLGKGRIYHVAAHPGLAYLWSALQPPAVPDRGPGTHSVPTKFDPGAKALIASVLEAGGVRPAILARPELIDGRLLEAPGGYILPVANYEEKVGQKVVLSVRAARRW